MAQRERLGSLVGTRRGNAAAAWLLVVFVASVVVGSAAVGNLLWAGFAAVVGALALIPALAHRDPLVMLPWEVLVLAALPLIGRVFATVPLTSRFATYLAVAALALIIAVELHLFTPVRMTPSFAVLFVVVGTMAAAGSWAVARWGSDLFLGTTFLLDPALSEHEIESGLMWEFVFSTAAGLVAGGIFEGYFRRTDRLAGRVPDSVEGSRP
ncbi:MAG: hypothetical protein U5J98_08965 [Halobacteriales archaeon]|nr:hypothetical protein [Halobacteriales archaeon]